MSERDIIVPSVRVKEKSVFSLDDLYEMLILWFEHHRYDFQERGYKDEDLGNKKHVSVRWYSEREINDYIKFVIETNFVVLGLEEVEIESGGVKRKSNRGEIELEIRAYIIKDFSNKWETGFMRFLRGFYDKFVIKSSIEGYEKELYEETYAYTDEIKSFLNLHRFKS